MGINRTKMKIKASTNFSVRHECRWTNPVTRPLSLASPVDKSISKTMTKCRGLSKFKKIESHLHTCLLNTSPPCCHLLTKFGELVYLRQERGFEEQESLSNHCNYLTSRLLASSRAAIFLCCSRIIISLSPSPPPPLARPGTSLYREERWRTV